MKIKIKIKINFIFFQRWHSIFRNLAKSLSRLIPMLICATDAYYDRRIFSHLNRKIILRNQLVPSTMLLTAVLWIFPPAFSCANIMSLHGRRFSFSLFLFMYRVTHRGRTGLHRYAHAQRQRSR